jgi:C1A family cysteine protease
LQTGRLLLAQTTFTRSALFVLGAMTAIASACSTAMAPIPGQSMLSGMGAAPKTAQHRFTLKFNKNSRKLKFVQRRDNTPALVDMRDKFAPIYDQGQLGSCTAFAWGKGIAEFLARQKGDKTPLSALYLYVQELKMENHLGQDAGAESMETGAKVLQQFGDCTDAEIPYLTPVDQMNSAKIKKALSTLPTDAQNKSAAKYRSTKSTPVNDLAAAKAELAAGHPVAMGIMVYESFQSPTVNNTGMVPVPDTNNEQLLGGHAVVAVGYDDAKQVLIMRNSWSTKWGDKGYFYLPYGYMNKDLVLDCWSAQ